MRYKNVFRALIVSAWVLSMGLVLRFEVAPAWFTGTIPGYRGMLSDSLLARESWSRLLIDGIPAGYSHTLLAVDDETPGHFLELINHVHLRFSLFGQPQRLEARTAVRLDHDYHPASFDTYVSAGDFSIHASGRRLEHRRFEMTAQIGETITVQIIDIPRETLIYSPIQELAMRNLRPGDRFAIKTFNPLTLQPVTLIVRALGREIITVGGETVEALRLTTAWQGLELQSWVDTQGSLLRQETPLGWVVESCTSAEALATVADSSPPPPLFGTLGTHTLLHLFPGPWRITP